jgi:hypothetical protein
MTAWWRACVDDAPIVGEDHRYMDIHWKTGEMGVTSTR